MMRSDARLRLNSSAVALHGFVLAHVAWALDEATSSRADRPAVRVTLEPFELGVVLKVALSAQRGCCEPCSRAPLSVQRVRLPQA
jgi:hypothetical protein